MFTFFKEYEVKFVRVRTGWSAEGSEILANKQHWRFYYRKGYWRQRFFLHFFSTLLSRPVHPFSVVRVSRLSCSNRSSFTVTATIIRALWGHYALGYQQYQNVLLQKAASIFSYGLVLPSQIYTAPKAGVIELLSISFSLPLTRGLFNGPFEGSNMFLGNTRQTFRTLNRSMICTETVNFFVGSTRQRQRRQHAYNGEQNPRVWPACA